MIGVSEDFKTAVKSDTRELSAYIKYDAGTGENGTLTNFARNNGAVTAPVTIDGGMVFDGATSSGGIVIADNTVDMTANSFVSLWVTVDSRAMDYMRILDAAGTVGSTLIWMTNTDNIVLSNIGTGDTTIAATYGTPMNIILSFEETETNIYVNGVLHGSADSVPPAITEWYMGNRTARDRTLDGTIHNFSVGSKTISLAEAQQIYAAGKDAYFPISEGLVAQYSGRDFAGTEATPTTIYDTNMIVEGKWGEAVSFDGVDDHIRLDNLKGKTPKGARTISAIFKSSKASGAQAIFDETSGWSGARGTLLRLSGNSIQFYIQTGGGAGTNVLLTGSFTAEEWHHAVGTWDGTLNTNAVKLYVDGQLVSQGTIPQLYTADNSYIPLIGASGTSGGSTHWFEGSISQLLLFGRALSLSEVQEIHTAGRDAYSPIGDGLIAQYSSRDYAGTEALPTTIYDTNMIVGGKGQSGIGIPKGDEEVEIEQDGTKLFSGRILRVFPNKKGNYTQWVVDCVDYTRDLDRNLVVEGYQSMTDKQIIMDIVDNYTGGTGITYDNVVEGVSISSMVFSYMPPSECISTICKLTGREWYIDYNKDIHYQVKTTEEAPFNITGTQAYKNLTIKKDNSAIRNRVYVRGGTYLSDEVTIKQVADGEQTVFNLPEKPHELTILEGATSKTVGIKHINNFTEFDYLMSYQEKYVETETAPVADTVLTFSFKYNIPVLVAVENKDSIEKYGQLEYVIFDKDIDTIAQARERALAELTDYAESIIEGSFETETLGFKAGQSMTVTLSDLDIDETFIVKSVNAKSIGGGNFVYKVRIVSAEMMGIIGFLIGLLESDKNILDISSDETVDEIKTITGESFELSDGTPVVDLNSDPFKYDSNAEWDIAEWQSV